MERTARSQTTHKAEIVASLSGGAQRSASLSGAITDSRRQRKLDQAMLDEIERC